MRLGVFIALALLAVGIIEGSIILIAASSQDQLTASWGVNVLGLGFTLAIFGFSYRQYTERNLRKSTAEPLRAWFLLQAIYWASNILNGVVVYAVILFVFGGGAFIPVWPVWVGVGMSIAVTSNFLIMQTLGQGYESLRGDSYGGAAAFARLARGMLSAKNRYGLFQLRRSLRMARKLFYARDFVPKDIDAISATLETLQDAPSLEFEKVSELATALEKLPDLATLPASFKTFLDSLEWPRSFEHVTPEPRHSDYPRLSVILSIVVALVAIIALFAEPSREAVLESIGGFIARNLLALIDASAVLVAVIFLVRTFSLSVPLLALYKYWPKENIQPEKVLEP